MKRILSVILMLCFALSLVTGDFSASADTETVYTEKLLKYVEANTEQGDVEFGAYWTPQGSAIIYCDTCGKSMQVRYERLAEPERTALPANSGSRLTRRIIYLPDL